MKRYLSLLVFTLCFSLTGLTQNVWEKPETEEETSVETKKEKKERKKKEKEKKDKEKKPKEDPKYLLGAVPKVDGKVKWTMDVDVPGKTAQEIYDIMFKYLTDLTKEENQLEGSAVSLVNKKDHIIVAKIREWLVFKKQFLVFDRTKFIFTLVASCSDGHLNVSMERLSYRYEENNGKEKYVYKAEDWIADDNAVNKKGTRLYKGSAKFRRKTIDRKDYLFKTIRDVVTR